MDSHIFRSGKWLPPAGACEESFPTILCRANSSMRIRQRELNGGFGGAKNQYAWWYNSGVGMYRYSRARQTNRQKQCTHPFWLLYSITSINTSSPIFFISFPAFVLSAE